MLLFYHFLTVDTKVTVTNLKTSNVTILLQENQKKNLKGIYLKTSNVTILCIPCILYFCVDTNLKTSNVTILSSIFLSLFFTKSLLVFIN